MILLASAMLMMSFGQSFSVPRNCTRDDLCRLVDASVCDSSKCLLLNQSAINVHESDGLFTYTWNVGRILFNNHCPMTVRLEECSHCGDITINKFVTVHSGIRCKESNVITSTYAADPGTQTGQVKMITLNMSGDTYQECYVYFEPGFAHVYRRCLVSADLPYGKACVAIYAKIVANKGCPSEGLLDFLNELDVELDRINVDCI